MQINNPPSLSVVIQAGGESQRMGRDKGLVFFLGQPLVARVVERMRPIASELLVTTNAPADYAFLGLPLHGDLLPGMGALGGLYTALSAANHPLVAVVACDMPFANSRLLAAQGELLLASGSDVAIPRASGGLEPFHAVYRRQVCLPHIHAALQAEKRRVDAWFARVKLYILRSEEVLPYDPQQVAFWNVNTPEELSVAEAKAREMGEEIGDQPGG